MDDPRISDEATGLPALEEIGNDEALLVLAWASGEGLVQSPFTGVVEPCRFIHLRGLAVLDNTESEPQWAQTHIAIPMSVAMEVAVALMGGNQDGSR